MSKLIIIEAPGKINSVKKAATAIWGFDCDVLATGGYLSVLPNDSIGVDLHTFEPAGMTPTESSLFLNQKLQKWRNLYGKKGPWDSIVIMTDPDREGEGIASQVYTIVKKWFPSATIERIYAQELTPDGLRNASYTDVPHAGSVAAQKARMVLDRLLPFAASCALHKPGEFKGLGRLQLESIKTIKGNISNWKRFLVEGTWRNKAGTFWVSHRTDSKERADEIIKALKDTKNSSEITAVKEEIIIDPPKPHSAFTLMASLHDMRPEVVMEKAQQAYMHAHISYPRTDQQVLGRTGLFTTASMIDSYHLSSKLNPDWHKNETCKKESWVQGAHSALYPLTGWKPPIDKEQYKVEAEIAARAMAAVMSPVRMLKTTMTIDAGDAGWITASKHDVLDIGWSSAYERVGLDNPVIPKAVFGKRLPMVNENFPTLSTVIEWLSDAHLGRPSTLAAVPDKLQKLGMLSTVCAPTLYAEQQLSEVARVMPMLVKPEFTHLMEKGLSHLVENPKDYTEVVKSLLVEAGVDIVGLPDMVKVGSGFEEEENLLESTDFFY